MVEVAVLFEVKLVEWCREGQPRPLFSACDSATRKVALLVVVRSGNVPLWPAPDHVTVQCTVAETRNVWPGSWAEERW